MSLEPPETVTSRASLLPLLLATCLDGLALAVLVSGGRAGCSLIAVAGLHLLACGAAGLATQAGRSQRVLMAALTLTLPLLGAVVAVAALRTRRRGEVGEIPRARRRINDPSPSSTFAGSSTGYLRPSR